MNATLKEERCDVVIGVPAGYDLVRTTKPYYRSTYVFVYPKGKGLQIKSLDDPILKKIKIGVHLLGDDYTNPPPVHELAKRGIVDNVVGFDTFYSARTRRAGSSMLSPPARSMPPSSGARRRILCRAPTVPLDVVPIPSGKTDLPFAFDISMGVRHGDDVLKGQLEKVLDLRSKLRSGKS